MRAAALRPGPGGCSSGWVCRRLPRRHHGGRRGLSAARPALPREVAEEAITGYTSSYTDAFPDQNGETNFNRELGIPYAVTRTGLAVQYNNEWYLCTPMNSKIKTARGGHRPCRF